MNQSNEERPDGNEPLRERPSRARYDKVRTTLDRKWRRRELRKDRMMREVVDVLWDDFALSPYSWCGFYVLSPDASQLILGPHREKPAPSPLALDSSAGQAIKNGRAAKAAGGRELAVPVFDAQDKVWAALVVQSAAPGAFDEMDERWLERIVKPFATVDRPD